MRPSGLQNVTDPVLRHEVHYGSRVVRCFAERPRHIDALLQDTAHRLPEATSLVLGDQRVSYRALAETVSNVAANLLALGLVPGDRVALALGNGLAFIELLLACARAGLIAVPMNVRQRRPETAYMLGDCGASVLVHDAAFGPNVPEHESTPALRHVFVVGGEASYDRLRMRAERQSWPDVAEEAVFCLLYTSGTTGRPKGAKLTHLGVVHSVLHYVHHLRLREGDVAILAVPASHVTGLVAVLLPMLRVGGTMVMMEAFKAREFLRLAAQERMSYTLMVPAMYNLCLLDPEFAAYDLASWRVAAFGGAPMPQATVARLGQALPDLTLVNVYGSTETSSPATMLPFGAIESHRDTVGVPLPCADVIVVDEAGREVPPGDSGEILIAGPMVVPGYWENETADRASFVGGYWISGDIGSKDADGFVRVLDRKKDMINRGGYKIYCTELESVLSQHPAVVECAVVGRPDPVLGERVHAFIYNEDRPADPADIRSWCGERLSDYKVPDLVTFLDAPLPRNANGKVLKTALREQG